MTDITLSQLTNKTSSTEGTGVFDLLQEAIELHLSDQFNEGRITGSEYATVYLGALQSVLSQAVTFILSEQEASIKIDLLEKQVVEAEERIDLVIAQKAKAYEEIEASRAKTARDNLLNSKEVKKAEKEIELLEAQLVEQQYITNNLRPAELAELQAATLRKDSESAVKVTLMEAQTTGFYSDTKQKVLKQIIDGWSVAFTVSSDATLPDYFDGVSTEGSVTGASSAIDTIIQSIIADAQQP